MGSAAQAAPLRFHTCASRGDGAHGRTAALFAFHTKHDNVSIDPNANIGVVAEWMQEIQTEVQRLTLRRARAEDVVAQEARNWWAEHGRPVLLTFVHAHVNTEKILSLIPPHMWEAAYVSACCEPQAQLVPKIRPWRRSWSKARTGPSQPRADFSDSPAEKELTCQTLFRGPAMQLREALISQSPSLELQRAAVTSWPWLDAQAKMLTQGHYRMSTQLGKITALVSAAMERGQRDAGQRALPRRR